MTSRQTIRILVLGVALLLVAAACGDSDTSADTTAATTTTAAAETTTTTAATTTTAGEATTTTAGTDSSEIEIASNLTTPGKLTIANTLGYAPFEFLTDDGAPTGVDIELAFAAADVLGLELEIVEIPFTSLIPAIAAGRADIGWGSFTVTEERLEQVDFVVFLVAGTVAAALPEVAATMSEQNDLCGLSIGIAAGSSADFTADILSSDCEAAGLAPIDKVIFPDVPEVIQAVLSGRVDARLEDSTAAGYYAVTSEGQMLVVPGLYDISPGGIVVEKGDVEMAEMMTAALQVLIDNGTYAEIFSKYGIDASAIEEAYAVTTIDELG